MWLKVVGDTAALDAKGAVGRSLGIDEIAFEHDRVVARPREGQRGRESCDTTPGDDELHTSIAIRCSFHDVEGRGGYTVIHARLVVWERRL